MAGDEGGGGQGGRWGGAPKNSVGESFWAPLKNLTTGLIWLVTRVGGWGEAWGGGPWRAGKGGDGGGAPESSVGATKGALVPGPPNNWSDLAGDEDGGRRGEVAHGGRARGEMGGHQRAVWEQQKVHFFGMH